MEKQRLKEIDIAKGIAIFLVVVGHVVARKPPLGNEWYVWLKLLIYKFHMPFFMFLSGAVFFLSYIPVTTGNQYFVYVSKKVKRLLPGFVLIGLVILFGKMLASQYLHVDNVPEDYAKAAIDIILNPTISASSSLWYIYVLLQYYLIFPLLLNLLQKNLIATVAIALGLHLLYFVYPVTNFLMAKSFCEYAIYFSLGIIAMENKERFIPFVRQYCFFLAGFFLVSFVSMVLVSAPLAKSIIGLSSIPALYGLSKALDGKKSSVRWSMLGKFTLTIYLLNTICIGFTKAIMLKFISWDYANFIFFFPVLLTAGLFGPISLYNFVLSRIAFIRTIVR